jgi:drug/metabolite transporter (DMT)-like permease
MSAGEAAAATRAAETAASFAAARWLTLTELTALGAIWGGSFLFMRVAAADFGAFPLVEVRLGLGAFVLLPFLWRERTHFTPALWARLAGIGAINSAIPFVLFAWAAQRAPAGIVAITNSMAVMFATLVAFLFYGEGIGPRRSIGLIAGFIGVVVLASGKVAGSSVWPAVAAGTFAALLYGFGVNLIRRYLVGLPASAVAASTLLSASIMLSPFAMYAWPRHPIPVKSWVSSVLLGVLCTGAAFVLYYRLIYRIGGPRAATVTYLVPLFSVIWAWLALGEPLTITMAISGALILGGVAISQRVARR